MSLNFSLIASVILINSSRTAKTQGLETMVDFLNYFKGWKESGVATESYIVCVLVTESITSLILHTGMTQSG